MISGRSRHLAADSISAGEAVQLPPNEQPQFILLLPVSDCGQHRNFAVPGVVLG